MSEPKQIWGHLSGVTWRSTWLMGEPPQTSDYRSVLFNVMRVQWGKLDLFYLRYLELHKNIVLLQWSSQRWKAIFTVLKWLLAILFIRIHLHYKQTLGYVHTYICLRDWRVKQMQNANNLWVWIKDIQLSMVFVIIKVLKGFHFSHYIIC